MGKSRCLRASHAKAVDGGRTIRRRANLAIPMNNETHIQEKRIDTRNKRKRDVRASTLAVRGITKKTRARWREEEPDDGRRRLPMVRAECSEAERPCPFISCRYHLFLDVDAKRGSIKFNFPDLIGDDDAPMLELMIDTCALDVAERDAVTLEGLGELLNMTRERVRQLELTLLEKIRKHPVLREILDAGSIEPFDGPSMFDEVHIEGDDGLGSGDM